MFRMIFCRAPCSGLACGIFALSLFNPPSAHAQPPASPGPSTNAQNPAVSVDGLFSLSQFNTGNPLVFEGGHDPALNGFNIQQVELSFNAYVDPYFRGDVNLVLTADGIEIEEAFATTLSLPWNLQVKGGQFFTAFGRQNVMHPHAWNFVDKPLVLGRDFGGDGLRNPGAQLSWLTPLPWYSEIIGSLQNSTGETAVSFRGANGIPMRSFTDGVALVRWNNFFSIGETLGLGAGVSALNGPNSQSETARTRIYGGDIYLRYRRPESLSFISLTFEAMERFYDEQGVGTVQDWGFYTELVYRLDAPLERWHLGLRYDWVSPRLAPVVTTSVDLDSSKRWRVSPMITYYPTEFSKVRLQYNYDNSESFGIVQHVAVIQLEFLMGAHGAHQF